MSLVALGPEMKVSGRPGRRGERLRHGVDDLVGEHHADVMVGNQGQRPTPLRGPGVEHDGPGGGDAHRASGDDGVGSVEFGYPERLFG